MELRIYPKPYFYIYRLTIKTKHEKHITNLHVTGTKHEKTIMAVLQTGIKISFILNFWPPGNTVKMKQRKTQKSSCNKFSKVFIGITGTYKKKTSRSYRHTNKCLK